MLIKKQTGALLTALMISLPMIGCGEDPVVTTPQTQTGQISSTELTKIFDRLDTISSKLDKLETLKSTPTTDTAKTTTSSAKPTTPTTPASTTPTTPASATPATPAKTTEDPKVKGRKILDQIVNTIKSANGLESEVNKFEKSLKDGHTINHTMKLYTNKAGMVRIDVLYASNGTSGVKVLYNSGVGDKIKVRPTGVLSLVTTEIDKHDDRITSANGYTADDTDFYGMARRFSLPSYEAELIGSSKINNESFYVLNLTCKTDNSLDKRIKYEHITFDPKTFSIKTWEAYTADDPKPYFTYNLKSFIILSTVPESNLKI
jgi:hypothetical protein